jgi:hypothetical protein
MIVTPTSSDLGHTRTRTARTASNIPEIRISVCRRGTHGGSIWAMASVFTKCPRAVKAKTRASPNRPAQSTSVPMASAKSEGVTNKPAMIAICFN